MPGLDGYEVTQLIRDPSSTIQDHSVPIIALTADAFPETRQRALAAGMDDFITKPLEQDALFQAICRNLKTTFTEPDLFLDNAPPELLQVASHQLFQIDYLASTVENNQALLIQLLSMFLTTTPIEFDKLRQAAKESDLVSITAISHKFKGTFGILGMQSIANDLAELQKLANVSCKELEIEALVMLVCTKYEKAKTEVSKELIRLQS